MPSFVLGATPPGPIVPAAPLLASFPLPVWAGSAGPVELPGSALAGLRFAVPCGCWVPVPVGVPVPCCFPVSSLAAIPGGGAVVVVAVDVALTGKTCAVEVLAFVLTSILGRIGARPVLIAFASVFSTCGICGPDPAWPVAAAAAMLACAGGATLMVLLITVVLWMLLKMMLFGGGAT